MKKLLFWTVFFAVTTVSAWITAYRIRGKIKKAIGRTVASEAELTSLGVWMKVEEAEKKKQSAPF